MLGSEAEIDDGTRVGVMGATMVRGDRGGDVGGDTDIGMGVLEVFVYGEE